MTKHRFGGAALSAALWLGSFAIDPGLVAAQTTTSSVPATTTSTLLSTTTSTLPGATLQHCYKVADALKVRSEDPAWLRLVHEQLGDADCRVVGGSRFVCMPVTAQVNAPIQGSLNGGAFAPLTPVPLPSEQGITQDRLCYKIKCLGRSALNDDTILYSDRFSVRQVSRFKSALVCGPAIRATCGNGTLDFGEQCDDGNNTDRDCCSALCTAEAAGKIPACVDNDGNVCTEAASDGLGACSQTGVLPTSAKSCADDDGNACTSARCDGAGECDQSAIFQPTTTVCSESDGNSCTQPRCDGAGVCDQVAIVLADGAGCAETDGNPCTQPLCSGGACGQGNPVGAGTICSEGDGNQCTTAACNGAGACDQNFFVRNCTPPQVCNPANGVCQ